MQPKKSKFTKLLNLLTSSYWFMPIVISAIGFIIIIIAAICMGKYHNPIEVVAATIILKETGIDIDSMLPIDEDSEK